MKKGNLLCLVLVILSVTWCLHSGTIRKKDDPIRKTQTNPIKYEEKMSEVKEGKKGAPTPSLRFYQDRNIETEPPYETTVEGEGEWEEVFPELEDEDFYLPEDEEGSEDLFEEEALSDEDLESWWWDENTVKETQ